MSVANPFTGEKITGNPWVKKTFNLTNQSIIQKADSALAERLKKEAIELDAEEARKANCRSIDEFNELDTVGKIQFINSGGEVTR
jgi:hypothetical protein